MPMPSIMVSPMPAMSDQRLGKRTGASFLPDIFIDPTCGRYTLKSLLKHHYERLNNITPENVVMPKPVSKLSDLIAYDPETDFQYFDDLLVAPDYLPASLNAYVDLLTRFGPIIVAGKGVGHAGSLVGHFILLVGGDSDANPGTLSYKDPLRGDALFTETYVTLGPKITWLCHARVDIGDGLNRVGLAFQVAAAPFK
jgi:hypothetical protein